LISDYYVYIKINEKFIPSSGYSKYFKHDLLVFGFDDEKELFTCISYNNGKYRTHEINYIDFVKISKLRMQLVYNFTAFNVKEGFEFSVDKCKLRITLSDFLKRRLFSSDIYRILYKKLNNKNVNKRIDYRNYKIIEEHKYLLLKCVEFLGFDEELIGSFKDLCNISRKLFYLAFKYNNSYDQLVAQAIEKYIKTIEKSEQNLLEKLNYLQRSNIL